MANEKDNGNNRIHKVPANPERIAKGEKETQAQILARGSKGNPSQKDWKGFLEKQQERDAASKPNLDAKVAERKNQLEKQQVEVKANREQDRKKQEHDKNR